MFWNHDWAMGWMAVWFLLSLLVFFVGLWIVGRFLWAPEGSTRDSPEAILKRRYAGGEIEREEFEKRLSGIRK